MLLLFLPETEPTEELELLLDVVVAVAFPLLLIETRVVSNGETGEPRSSSLKSGLFISFSLMLWSAALKLSESRYRLVRESRLGLLECDDIFLSVVVFFVFPQNSKSQQQQLWFCIQSYTIFFLSLSRACACRYTLKQKQYRRRRRRRKGGT